MDSLTSLLRYSFNVRGSWHPGGKTVIVLVPSLETLYSILRPLPSNSELKFSSHLVSAQDKVKNH